MTVDRGRRLIIEALLLAAPTRGMDGDIGGHLDRLRQDMNDLAISALAPRSAIRDKPRRKTEPRRSPGDPCVSLANRRHCKWRAPDAPPSIPIGPLPMGPLPMGTARLQLPDRYYDDPEAGLVVVGVRHRKSIAIVVSHHKHSPAASSEELRVDPLPTRHAARRHPAAPATGPDAIRQSDRLKIISKPHAGVFCIDRAARSCGSASAA